MRYTENPELIPEKLSAGILEEIYGKNLAEISEEVPEKKILEKFPGDILERFV